MYSKMNTFTYLSYLQFKVNTHFEYLKYFNKYKTYTNLIEV